MQWIRKQGHNPNDPLGSGPATDHTTGTRDGYYLYLLAINITANGNSARATSGFVRRHPGAPQCLTFFYHMFGVHTHSLALFQQFVTLPELGVVAAREKRLWLRARQVGNEWKQAQVTVYGDEDYTVLLLEKLQFCNV